MRITYISCTICSKMVHSHNLGQQAISSASYVGRTKRKDATKRWAGLD